jgi:hypothetical protein
VNLLNVLLLMVWFEPIRERFVFSNLYAVHLDNAWIEGKVLKRMLNLLNVPPKLGNQSTPFSKGEPKLFSFTTLFLSNHDRFLGFGDLLTDVSVGNRKSLPDSRCRRLRLEKRAQIWVFK